MLKKKEKRIEEPQYYVSKINNQVLNYCVYKMGNMEKIAYWIVACIVGGIVGLIFYANLFMKDGEPTLATHISNIVVFCSVGIIAGNKFIPLREEQLCKKRKEILKMQFREMLSCLSTCLASGDNVREAFQSTYKEMSSQYGENSYIAKELKEVVLGMENNFSIEEILENFAIRSGIDDIKSFSEIFMICYEKGGNLKSVVRNTYELIGEKMTINEEIETKLTSNKMQQNVMSVVPIIMIAFLRLTSTSFAENFASLKGVVSMTVAIGIFIGSYLYGKKITDIKG